MSFLFNTMKLYLENNTLTIELEWYEQLWAFTIVRASVGFAESTDADSTGSDRASYYRRTRKQLGGNSRSRNILAGGD